MDNIGVGQRVAEKGEKKAKGTPKQKGKKLCAAERRRRAISMYKSGADVRTIAERLTEIGIKCSKSTVANDIREVFSELQTSTLADAEHLRSLQYMRLNSMLVALWSMVIGGDAAAISVALKAMKQMNELFGLEAARRHEIAGKIEVATKVYAGFDPEKV